MPRALKKGEWALEWDCCQECGTIERPHYANGLCTLCYGRGQREKGRKHCIDCGAEISPRATHCEPCQYKRRRVSGISEDWLRQKYAVERLTDQEIAEIAGCSTATINKYREQFGISTLERQEETSRRISAALQGKKLSASHRQAIRESHLGNRLTMEHRRTLSEAGMGHQVSEETRRKIGEANKGHPVSEETRQAVSESNKGRDISYLHTPEVRRKIKEAGPRISAGIRAAWARGAFDDRNHIPPFVEYNGIPMRSTWEARLAAVFDALQWQWEYEPQRFLYELDDGPHTYTPDFYVRETNTFYDPHWALDDASDKFNAVRAQHDIALIVLDETLLEMYERAAPIA